MSEIILLYHKDDFDTIIEVDRDLFYENRRTTYAEHYVYVIDMFVFNRYGELLIQKRAKHKKKSPGLYHTSVGGHINQWDSPQLTVLKECLEEIGAPCVLLESEEEFSKWYSKLKEFTTSFVLAYPEKSYNKSYLAYTDKDGRVTDLQDVCYLCFGIFNWPIQSLDRSADGFERYTIDDLKTALDKSPGAFTSSFHIFFDELEQDLRKFVKKYCI